jgi:cytochrome b561
MLFRPPESVPAEGRYTRTAITLHWLIAVLIACGFGLGWTMTHSPAGPLRLLLINWHKSVGISVLCLAILRTGWRLKNPPPPFLRMPTWQRLAARSLHAGLYLLLFALPLAGWASSNASGHPVVYFGLVHLPALVPKDEHLAKSFGIAHGALGMFLLLLTVVHIVAALKHHFIERDVTLERILGRRRTRRRAAPERL